MSVKKTASLALLLASALLVAAGQADAQAPKDAEPRGHRTISADSAYELARNKLLVKAAGLSLQIQLATDEARRGELEAGYAGVMDELEEFGVGSQDETVGNPGHYLDKYGEAVERFERMGFPAAADVESAGLADRLEGTLHSLQVFSTYLYPFLPGLLIQGMGFLAQA